MVIVVAAPAVRPNIVSRVAELELICKVKVLGNIVVKSVTFCRAAKKGPLETEVRVLLCAITNWEESKSKSKVKLRRNCMTL